MSELLRTPTRMTAVAALLTLGLSACGASGDQEPVTPESSMSQPMETEPSEDFTESPDVSKTFSDGRTEDEETRTTLPRLDGKCDFAGKNGGQLGQAVWVEAGVANIHEAYYARPVIVPDSKGGYSLARVTVNNDRTGFTFVPVGLSSDEELYVKPGAQAGRRALAPYDGCKVPAGMKPPSSYAQAVTITGGGEVDGVPFASFNDGEQRPVDRLDAYRDKGAVGLFLQNGGKAAVEGLVKVK